MGLLPPGARQKGTISFQGRDLSGLSREAFRQIRGNQMAMVFQDPFESMNPVMNVGNQIAEAILAHQKGVGTEARVRHLLEEVQVPDARRFVRLYPHEASGGMRQRAMIAMALSCDPALLIADEPTTALDVTTQAGILELFTSIKSKRDMAILLITHDLALVSQVADRVSVMYAGRIVESAPAAELFGDPLVAFAAAVRHGRLLAVHGEGNPGCGRRKGKR